MDEGVYVGFVILESSKLDMFETYYDKLQPYLGLEDLQLHYIDTNGKILSMKTPNIIKDLKNLEDIFDFSNLDENHELFSDKVKKVGKFKIETPKKFWLDKFVCLRSKTYSFKCEDNIESKNKIKKFLNLNQNILNLKNITIVCLVENIKKNVIIVLFDLLIMKCIFKK